MAFGLRSFGFGGFWLVGIGVSAIGEASRPAKSGSARSPSACVLCVFALTLLHRTLVFPLGRAGPRPEASQSAHVFRNHSRAMAGFGAAVDDPRKPAGEHHEHSGARNRPCGARRCFANLRVGFGSPQRAHHQHQRGVRWRGAAWACSRLLPAAAPRINRPMG